MADVAARAGVSRALVSLVFRDARGPSAETRAHVLRVAGEIGYRLDPTARLLRSSRSRLLGVVLDIRNPFHADLVDGLHAAAERAGYRVALGAVTPGRVAGRAAGDLLESRCEGVVLLGSAMPAGGVSGLADRAPVVVMGRRAGDTGADVVRTADADGAGAAVDHLVALGHRDVVHVDGARLPGSADRRRGYRAAMRRHGFAGRARVLPGDGTEDAGVRAALTLRSGGPLPTAVVMYNDRSAVGLLDALLRAGVDVPAEVSVVGYDDSSLARMTHVDLTSVGQDAAGMAAAAVDLLVERLDGGRRAARDVVLPPHLVVRGTTGPRPLPAGARGPPVVALLPDERAP